MLTPRRCSALLAGPIAALFCLPAASPGQNAISGSGCSVSVPGYLADLARAYEKETRRPVLVVGGGSQLGLADLREGRTDFAASCMSKLPGDPDDLTFITVAWDALVFIVHPSNPITSITPDQIRDIYSGRIDNWKDLGGPNLGLVSVISTPEGMGGIGQSLARLVLGGQVPQRQHNSSLQAGSAAIWEQVVESTPAAFATSGFGSARKRAVKMLAVGGVVPSKKAIIADQYPFRRPLYLVLPRNPKPEARQFVDFALSARGQGLISSYGIPSLADVK